MRDKNHLVDQDPKIDEEMLYRLQWQVDLVLRSASEYVALTESGEFSWTELIEGGLDEIQREGGLPAYLDAMMRALPAEPPEAPDGQNDPPSRNRLNGLAWISSRVLEFAVYCGKAEWAALVGIAVGMQFQQSLLHATQRSTKRTAKQDDARRRKRDERDARSQLGRERFCELYPSQVESKTVVYRRIAKEMGVDERTVRRWINGK